MCVRRTTISCWCAGRSGPPIGPSWGGLTVTLLDQQAIVSGSTRDAFAALGWKAEPVRADVLEYLASLRGAKLGAITANLFLHHFSSDQLKELMALAAQSTRLFV